MLQILKIDNITVGEGTIFYDPSNIVVDSIRPHLIEIGKYCKITSGVTILTHDYSKSVLRMKYGNLIGEGKKTIIGDNVFVGMNSIILMGSKIGNNTIIGAGSVVSGKFEDDVVIAGNPARVIMTLDKYYESKINTQLEDSYNYIDHFFSFYRRLPTIKEMGHFFPLFLKRDINELKKYNISLDLNGDIKDDILNYFMKTKPLFESF